MFVGKPIKTPLQRKKTFAPISRTGNPNIFLPSKPEVGRRIRGAALKLGGVEAGKNVTKIHSKQDTPTKMNVVNSKQFCTQKCSREVLCRCGLLRGGRLCVSFVTSRTASLQRTVGR